LPPLASRAQESAILAEVVRWASSSDCTSELKV
jgi:hypothetical protein